MLDPKEYWYIAGPMSNYPQFNIPMFAAVAWYLRQQGEHVISPPEMDDEIIQHACLESVHGRLDDLPAGSWGNCLARDVAYVADPRCIGIVLLPGWEYSGGARVEVMTALARGKHFRAWNGKEADTTLTRTKVVKILTEAMTWDYVLIGKDK